MEVQNFANIPRNSIVAKNIMIFLQYSIDQEYMQKIALYNDSKTEFFCNIAFILLWCKNDISQNQLSMFIRLNCNQDMLNFSLYDWNRFKQHVFFEKMKLNMFESYEMQ